VYSTKRTYQCKRTWKTQKLYKTNSLRILRLFFGNDRSLPGFIFEIAHRYNLTRVPTICSELLSLQQQGLKSWSTEVSAREQCRSQPKNLGSKKFWGDKMFYFRRITLFCLEKRLSKHKMTMFSKIWGGHGAFGSSTPMQGLRLCKGTQSAMSAVLQCLNILRQILLKIARSVCFVLDKVGATDSP